MGSVLRRGEAGAGFKEKTSERAGEFGAAGWGVLIYLFRAVG
jgi:hypothetical protein